MEFSRRRCRGIAILLRNESEHAENVLLLLLDRTRIENIVGTGPASTIPAHRVTDQENENISLHMSLNINMSRHGSFLRA